ncbi:hypothetical protein CY34DRAFT_50098, partial [Suillus luteus UH-Slu-Lm8-n1]
LHNFPVEPTPYTLSFYVVYMCQHIQPCSVECYLTGIISQLEPYFPAVHSIRQSHLVKQSLQGSACHFGRPVRRKQPLIREDLVQVLHDLARPWAFHDLLWVSQLLLGFFSLMRLGELVWPDQLDLQDYSKLSLHHSVRVDTDFYSFLLPRDKADFHFEGNQVLIQRLEGDDDPLAPFIAYLNMCYVRFPLQPFLWLHSTGTPPMRAWFIQCLHTFFPASIAGHSLRAGGATSLVAA